MDHCLELLELDAVVEVDLVDHFGVQNNDLLDVVSLSGSLCEICDFDILPCNRFKDL